VSHGPQHKDRVIFQSRRRTQ